MKHLLIGLFLITMPFTLFSTPAYDQLVAAANQFQKKYPPGKGPLRGFYDIGADSRPLLGQIDAALKNWKGSKDAEVLKGIVLLQAVIVAVDHAEPFSDEFLALSAANAAAFSTAAQSLPDSLRPIYFKRLADFQGAARGGH